jgi:hypothetical protein
MCVTPTPKKSLTATFTAKAVTTTDRSPATADPANRNTAAKLKKPKRRPGAPFLSAVKSL